MFPNTRSTPSETRVLMGSIRLRGGTTLLAWLLLVLISLVSLFALYQMNLLGLLPSNASWDEVSLFAYTKPFQTARMVIPVSGGLSEPTIQHTFVDNFTLDTGDWSALQGKASVAAGGLNISPEWLINNGIAVWKLPEGLLTDSFTFSADLTSRAKAFQRFGLVINALPDGSCVLAIIEPDTGEIALVQRVGAAYTALTPWQISPTLLPPPGTNHLEVECNAQMLVMRVNGAEAASAAPPLPCNQGQIGAFILTPGSSITVDNVSLSTFK